MLSQTNPQRRIVLLGASNLTRAISIVVDTAIRTWGGPCDLLIAHGHGRSYGLSTRVFGMGRRGISACGLWPELARRESLPTAALVTDIGNDLLYAALPREIMNWVRACLDRLEQVGARALMTQVPLANVARLTPARYVLMRSLLFPSSRVSYAEITERAAALAEEIARVARERDIPLLEQPADWYGLDPLHHRRGLWKEIWRRQFARWWSDHEAVSPARSSLRRFTYLRRLAADEYCWLGWRRSAAQPAGMLHDGSQVSIF